MDSQRHYELLMEKARVRQGLASPYRKDSGQFDGTSMQGYERHHVLPRALGGTDARTNIVWLSYREHFIAHWLLTKFTEGVARQKMLCALRFMVNPRKGAMVVAAWQYEVARQAQRQAMLGKFKGKTLSPEHCRKISLGKLKNPRVGYFLTEEQKQARRSYRHTPETKARIAAASREMWLRGNPRGRV